MSYIGSDCAWTGEASLRKNDDDLIRRLLRSLRRRRSDARRWFNTEPRVWSRRRQGACASSMAGQFRMGVRSDQRMDLVDVQRRREEGGQGSLLVKGFEME